MCQVEYLSSDCISGILGYLCTDSNLDDAFNTMLCFRSYSV